MTAYEAAGLSGPAVDEAEGLSIQIEVRNEPESRKLWRLEQKRCCSTI